MSRGYNVTPFEVFRMLSEYNNFGKEAQPLLREPPFSPESIQYPGHFLFRVFNSRHDVHSASWRRYMTGISSIFSC